MVRDHGADGRDVVQGLWVEGDLSRIERLSIESFVRNGHEYHLYTYNDAPYDLPAGAVQMDAAEIVPRHAVWQHGFGDEVGSLAGFSDYFRFRLLYERGGIWADADLICLRPLRIDRPLFIAAETARPGIDQPSTQLLKFPSGDPLLRRAIDYCESRDSARIEFLQVGPQLIHRLVEEMDYGAHVLPAKAVNPVPWWEYYVMFLAEHGARLAGMRSDKGVFCVHLWNEMIRRLDVSKDAPLEPQCAIAQLLDQYGIGASDRQLPGAAEKLRSRMLFAEATTEIGGAPRPDYRSAVWREIMRLDPGFEHAYRSLAALSGTVDEVGDLERIIDAAPAAVGTHPLVLIERSKAHARIGGAEESDRLLDEAAMSAIRDHPATIGSVFQERFRRRDLEKIEALFVVLRNEMKSRPDVLFAVARTRLARADHSGALRLAERVIALDPGFLNSHTLAAEILIKLGRIDEAEQHAIRATEAWQRPWPWKVLGRIYLSKGLEEKARGALLKCRELGGDDRLIGEALGALSNAPSSAP